MQVVKMSEAAAIAVHAAVVMAVNETEHLATGEIAERLGVSHDHCSKVLQRLTKTGIVNAYRGPKGGYALARSPARIRLAEVVTAIDGPTPAEACLFHNYGCRFDGCLFADLLKDVSAQVRDYFELASLAMAAERLRKTDPAAAGA